MWQELQGRVHGPVATPRIDLERGRRRGVLATPMSAGQDCGPDPAHDVRQHRLWRSRRGPRNDARDCRAALASRRRHRRPPGFQDLKDSDGGRSTLPRATSRSVAIRSGTRRPLPRRGATRLRHVKPHGALYNMAARDAGLADAVARAAAAVDPAPVCSARRLELIAPGQAGLRRLAKCSPTVRIGRTVAAAA